MLEREEFCFVTSHLLSLTTDPQPAPGKSPSRRGVGFSFGPDITANFLAHNDLSLVVRSHEVKDEGNCRQGDGKGVSVGFGCCSWYKCISLVFIICLIMCCSGYVVEHDGKCITIFSAPNYCDQMGNKGAFIRFSEDTGMKAVFTQFAAVGHPNIPPMHYASAMSQFGI